MNDHSPRENNPRRKLKCQIKKIVPENAAIKLSMIFIIKNLYYIADDSYICIIRKLYLF